MWSAEPLGKAKRSRWWPYIVSFPSFNISGGSTNRAILSRQSPMAISVVVARILWSVSSLECTSKVWPPETSRERNGKAGAALGELPERADTRRGVSACACMWLTPTRGIRHATARPFAVSSPVARLERIPGPRVTEMKSGLEHPVPGRTWRAFAMRIARFS